MEPGTLRWTIVLSDENQMECHVQVADQAAIADILGELRKQGIQSAIIQKRKEAITNSIHHLQKDIPKATIKGFNKKHEASNCDIMRQDSFAEYKWSHSNQQTTVSLVTLRNQKQSISNLTQVPEIQEKFNSGTVNWGRQSKNELEESNLRFNIGCPASIQYNTIKKTSANQHPAVLPYSSKIQKEHKKLPKVEENEKVEAKTAQKVAQSVIYVKGFDQHTTSL